MADLPALAGTNEERPSKDTDTREPRLSRSSAPYQTTIEHMSNLLAHRRLYHHG
jgi:hypothetical protein